MREIRDEPGLVEEIRRHRHGGRRGYGRPGLGFGGPGPWMGERGYGRGPRAKRGDIRAASLALLAEEPRNGYQIIQAISERSEGVWEPSPGSVYPALQQLEDEGLIRSETPEGGRRRYALTEEGRAYVAAHPEETNAPWDMVARSVGDDSIRLQKLFHEVAMAAMQVVRVGTPAQVARAQEVLVETRRGLYRLLAADDAEQGGE